MSNPVPVCGRTHWASSGSDMNASALVITIRNTDAVFSAGALCNSSSDAAI